MVRRLQFSLRHFLVAVFFVGLLVSLLANIFARVRADAELIRLVSTIITQHDASVRVKNGNIVWLDGNAELAPYRFLTLGEIGDLGFGSAIRGHNVGKPFDDAALTRLVDRHQAIEVLDLRGTKVSPAGLSCLETMPKLQWLFVDNAQCEAVGMQHILNLSKLKRLMVDGNPTTATIDSIQQSLGSCVVQTHANQTGGMISVPDNN